MDDRDAFSEDMHATLDLATSDLLLDDPSSPLVEREFERLAEMLSAMRAPASPAELAGEAAALDAFRAATTARPFALTRRRRLAVMAAACTASLGLGTGLAAAAGVLPGPAQDFVSSALDTVGVHVPDSHGHKPDGVPPTSTPPHATPPDSTPVGPPITPPGQDPTFNPGQSGEDHGHDPQATPPTAPPSKPSEKSNSAGSERSESPESPEGNG